MKDSAERPTPEAAREYVMVAFVGAAPADPVFAKSSWPLHLTLLRFNLPAALDAVQLVAPVMDPVASLPVRIGADAAFGYRGRVPVSLVEHGADLQMLHEGLARVVEAAGGELPGRQHCFAGYRAHISGQRGQRPAQGEDLILTDYGLIDMRPGGDSSVRRILREWKADS